MAGRWERRLADATVVLVVVLGALVVVTLLVAAVPAATILSEIPFLTIGPVSAGLGALIVHRRPGTTIARLLLVASVAVAVLHLTWIVASLHAAADAPPVVVWAGWASSWVWVPLFAVLLVLVPLRYPDGRLVSPAWRWIERAALITFTCIALLTMVRPGPLESGDLRLPYDNPLGMVTVGRLDGVLWVWTAAMISLVLLAFASVVVRYRRSDAVGRQQVKVLAFALVVFAVLATLGSTVPLLAPIGDAIAAFFLLVPIAITVALLRHGLYDIDRVISRTVAWALLTAVLVAIYATGVLVLGTLSRAVTGSDASDLVIASSTLVVAALFQPVRRRIQVAVDRRFNRARYDAAATVAAFGAHLRDEVDLHTVVATLWGTTMATLQPSDVRVWMVAARSGDDRPPT
jgi:hypothetical protein